MKVVAVKMKLKLPEDLSIDSEVGIGPVEPGFAIKATLNITLPGIDKATANQLIETAHQVCPYSNATCGNTEVSLNLMD